MDNQYQPIDCGVYDEIEVLAMQKKPCEIEFRQEDLTVRSITTEVLDVYSKDHAEWVKLASGDVVRLDQIVRLNGRELGGACDL